MERYVPETIPNTADISVLVAFLSRELQRVSAAIQALASGELEVSHVEPSKLFTGLVRFADGTNWDPGAGRGIYYYDEDVPGWVKL